MDQQPSGPRTRSMNRQNSSTVEHVTNRLDRVSTEEVKNEPVQEIVNISPPRKHKLSTSKDPSSKKKIRQQSRNEQDVRKLTRAVLKKFLEVQDSSKKTPRRKRSRQQGISPPLACTFNQATTATKTVEKAETSGPSSLDFGGAIEPDGSALSVGDAPIEADGDNANTRDDGQQGTSSIDPNIVELGEKLRNIGDNIDKKAKRIILLAALQIAKEKSYKKYKECLTILIDDNKSQIGDGSESSMVAVVCLLTQMVVTKAKDAMVSDATVDEVVEAATEYIVENHPTWV